MIPLAIKAAGMVTAVGFNAASSCAAMRAGISGVKQTNLWDAESGEYISAAKVPLPHWWEGLGKLAELAAPAIHECLVAAAPVPASQIALFLGIAGADRPHRLKGLEDELLDEIEFRLDVRFHRESKIIPRSQVSAVVGIQEAARLIDKGLVRFCIVAGVDSFLQQNVVEAYMQERRVLTPKNSNGFIPGEAGCAVLVGTADGAIEGELRVLGCGLAWEEATVTSGKPLRGDGLAEAMGTAFSEAGITIFEVNYRITDLDGEHYKFKEATIAPTRFHKKRKEGLFDLWHPIEYLGEVGAAIGSCVMGLALYADRKHYAPGPVVLCHFGSDDGERSVMVASFEPWGGS
jgi:3-oxoacyl-[acyl-carrier-protein] synthase-1